MVDCDFFTEFNKQVIIEGKRLLLDYKNCDYTLELSFPYRGCTKVPKNNSNGTFLKKFPIKAVYGIVEMEVNSYLLVVTKASVIGQIYHRKVFQLQKMEYICLAEKEDSKDKQYINGLEDIFSNKYWYFSDDYDLTNSLQQFVSSGCSLKNKKMQYMYNSDWIDDFLKIKAYEWITGFISGYISINFTHAGANNSCELVLLTRRDKRRQGRRWLSRGCNLDGNTSNTAQTEIIFSTQTGGKESVFSYVQLRGSMPFVWKQTPDLKWEPKVVIHPNDKLNSDLLTKNYEDIKSSYENCTLINTIDKKSQQKKLGDYLQKMHAQTESEGMRLVWFDFHAECKNMKYQNLSKLLDKLADDVQNYGFFQVEGQANSSERVSKKSMQKGIMRTNCMDCLDRTNVVQSVIARQLLLKWMSSLGIMNKSRINSAFETLPDSLQQIFRAQWTKNADIVSVLYSGTPAMKTDFTATGKRTTKGAVKDGVSSVKRYFLGNFYDNRTQDYIDFSLGKIKPKRGDEKIRHSPFNSLFLLIILTILAFMLVSHQVDVFMPDSFNFPVKLVLCLISAGVVLFTFKQLKSVLLRQPIKGDINL